MFSARLTCTMCGCARLVLITQHHLEVSKVSKVSSLYRIVHCLLCFTACIHHKHGRKRSLADFYENYRNKTCCILYEILFHKCDETLSSPSICLNSNLIVKLTHTRHGHFLRTSHQASNSNQTEDLHVGIKHGTCTSDHLL